MLKVEENVTGSPNVIADRREGCDSEIFGGKNLGYSTDLALRASTAQFESLVPLT
jgi:hypothetical protein